MSSKLQQQSKEIAELKIQLTQAPSVSNISLPPNDSLQNQRQPRSYSEVARQGINNHDLMMIDTPKNTPPKPTNTTLRRQTLYVVIDITKSPEEEKNLSHLKDILQESMKKNEHTAAIDIVKVIQDRDPDRFRVVLKSGKDAETVRKFDQWVERALIKAFLVRPRLVSVRVNHVLRSAVLADISTTVLRESLAAEISEENKISVKDIKWLSGVNSKKRYGPIVLRLSGKEEAEAIKAAGSISICGDTGYTAEFIPQQGPFRCYKCQEYGHRAAACGNPIKCSICAEDHHYSTCTRQVDKCGSCGGPHRAMKTCCPNYQRQREILITTRHG